jgi:topoisomerase-4 subunit A
MKKIQEAIKETKANLKNLTGYTIAWFEMLQAKYGKGIKRRTSYDEIAQIDVSASSRPTSAST